VRVTPLRERKKNETRTKLTEAALELAIERGISGFKIEDIAAAANVSPRTFNNYFSSKEAAVVGSASDRGERICLALSSLPADIPLEIAIRRAVLEEIPEAPDKSWMARLMLIRDDPSLRGAQRRADAEVEEMLTSAIVARTGVDPHQDIFPRLVAAAVIATVHATITHWLGGSKLQSFRETLQDALDRVHINPGPFQ
jgi:AcrR family transcriptional regulator